MLLKMCIDALSIKIILFYILLFTNPRGGGLKVVWGAVGLWGFAEQGSAGLGSADIFGDMWGSAGYGDLRTAGICGEESMLEIRSNLNRHKRLDIV